MAEECSFDIVSKVDLQEVDNAVNQAVKELALRFDFKGSLSRFEFDRNSKKIILWADDEMKLKGLKDILMTRCAKRGVSLKALRLGPEEKAFGGQIRQEAEIVQGIPQTCAKEIVQLIKELRLKVQATIQGDQVRVSGKKKDDLQEVIRRLRQSEFEVALQFVNYR